MRRKAIRDAMSPASEPVLAAQEFMMDRALDQLEDERPGVTDLYFVGFAPDARRPGFVADVEAAQRAMDERWHTKGRSVVLVNSPLTVAERPFATITHLREVLLRDRRHDRCRRRRRHAVPDRQLRRATTR